MSTGSASPADAPREQGRTLRLIWPQWQGAGQEMVGQLLPEAPLDRARRGYALGARFLEAMLPEHDGPTEVVPVPQEESGSTGGIESREQILASLDAAQEILSRHGDAPRILTLGGECSVSVVPFTELARRHGEDLAVVWIDAHPDVDTPDTGYDGYHAMAVSAIVGQGDPEILDRLPAAVDPARVALAGLHDGEQDALAHLDEWGLSSFSPADLRESTRPLLDWLAGTGAGKVAVHLDVDVVDSDEAALGLGLVPGGLTRAQVRRIIADLDEAADVVGLSIAEFIPRSVLAMEALVDGLPLTER